MYAAAAKQAADNGGALACEVNTRPRNKDSLAFHERLGFKSVGEQDTDGGQKTVTMLLLDDGKLSDHCQTTDRVLLDIRL